MKYTSALIASVAGLALVTAPLTSASAHGRHGGGLLFGLVAAATVGAVAIATAPARAVGALVAAPAYAPPPAPYGYAPQPYGYAPAPVYAPPPPPPGYYYPYPPR